MAGKVFRKIIKIDEDKCNGCGLCVSACHEGALQIVDGKAKLVRDDFCDGLGACIGECPQGALTFEEREAAPFDEAAVQEHLAHVTLPVGQAACLSAAHDRQAACPTVLPCGCPSAEARSVRPQATPETQPTASALANWPTQLMLVPVQAQYLQGADLLISADCVPFAHGGFHSDLLPGKVVLQACPKLDNIDFYREKLTAIFTANDLHSVTVARMEVPCCGGLTAAVRHALAAAGKQIPLEVITISIGGEVLDRQLFRAEVAIA